MQPTPQCYAHPPEPAGQELQRTVIPVLTDFDTLQPKELMHESVTGPCPQVFVVQ